MKKLLLAFLITISLSFTRKDNKVTIVISKDADKIEKFAADELSNYLTNIYPDYVFTVSDRSSAKRTIYLGTKQHLQKYNIGDITVSDDKEGFVIKHFANKYGIITSSDSAGVLRGVYYLIEKLGYSYTFSGDINSDTNKKLDFKDWEFSDEPLVSERTVFNWHNFLSGCTGWDLEDWNMWTDQSQKMGYNTIMVHAYPNNPLYTFQYNGQTKPVGYLASSMVGRDWSTEHVNDVRRLPGGQLFDGPIFGSSASKGPEEEKIEVIQEMMKAVFQHAKDRGVNVNLAIDFDLVAGIPQDMVKTIPEGDRFMMDHKGINWMGEKPGQIWLPRPDRPEGYKYYKTQVKAALDLYPQISIYTMWKRSLGSVWTDLKLEQLPKEWQEEYLQYVKKKPGVENLNQSVSSFAQVKLINAYRKAFVELGRPDIRLSLGTWDWIAVESMNEFYPDDISVYILDSEVIRSERNLHNEKMIDDMAGWIKNGRIIPVIWPQHDDGAYIGSPLTPFNKFNNTLTKLRTDGFGVIHWMTRPFDSFFIHHVKQVLSSSENQDSDETLGELSEKWFGKDNSKIMKDYLIRWNKDMPTFGRETFPEFIDKLHYHKFSNIDSVVNQSEERIQLLEQINTGRLKENQLQVLKYFLNLEIFVKDFFIEQDKFLKTFALLESGDVMGAKKIIATFRPEEVLEQYAEAIRFGNTTKGEKGLLFSMGLRWLPQFITLRQIVGFEKIRINMADTSHEEMAQLPGFRTYHVDAENNFWEVLGEKELAAPIVRTVKESILDDKIRPYEEIFQQGVKVASEITIEISPVMTPTKINPNNFVGKGKYRFNLLVSSEKDKEITFDMDINGDKGSFSSSGKTVVSKIIEQKETGPLSLNIKPVNGDVVICGVTLDPVFD